MVTTDLIAFVNCCYVVMSLWSSENMDSVSTILVSISFLSFGAFCFDMLIYLNHMSQSLANGATNLKNAILGKAFVLFIHFFYFELFQSFFPFQNRSFAFLIIQIRSFNIAKPEIRAL